MKALRREARKGGRWQRFEVDLGKAGHLMREAGFLINAADPLHAWAHRDRQRRIRKVHAEYADGWRATLVVRLDGSCSLSQSIRLVGEIRALAQDASLAEAP